MSQISNGQLHKFVNGEVVADDGTAGINTFLNVITAAHNDTDNKLSQLSSQLTGGLPGSVNKKIGEVFAANQGQTVFTLTKGTYILGSHMLDVYVNGVRKSLDNGDFAETDNKTFTMASPLNTNDKVEAEYWQGITVTPAGSPSNVSVASASDVLIISSGQQIASYLPTVQGNYLIGISYRVITSTTSVTITISYNDASGSQTDTILNAQSTAVGTYRVIPAFINAVAGTSIIVSVTASNASQVYVSASILEV